MTVRVVQLPGRVCDPKVVGDDTKCLSNLTFCVLYLDGCITEGLLSVGLMTSVAFVVGSVVGAVLIIM